MMQKTSLIKQKSYNIPKMFFSGLITVYQWTLSPDHGVVSLYTTGVCKFRPTCSEYVKSMIIEYGAVEGFKKGLEQVKKCH